MPPSPHERSSSPAREAAAGKFESSPAVELGANALAELLASHPGLAEVAAAPERHRLQVVLGVVEEREGRPTLVQHGYRLGAEYFYPASAVKLFAAVAALERLAELRRQTGLPLDADTPLVFHPLFADETLEAEDPSHLAEGPAPGRITVGHEIRKLFLVSDNQAFNRLYELVGQDGLAASLARAGLDGARIVHRLEEARTPEENRRAPRIDFLAADGSVLHSLPERAAPPLPSAPAVPGLRIGRAHLAGGERIEEPLDFAGKNRISLADLQRGLCMVVRPDADCGGPGFRLDEADRARLLEAMTTNPGDSPDPAYDRTEYPDAYVKPLLPGLQRVIPKSRLRIANKTGQAYGFTIENAWITDRATGRSLFLAATLYTNADETLNDDRYEYRETALPFLADLGEAVGRLLSAEASGP